MILIIDAYDSDDNPLRLLATGDWGAEDVQVLLLMGHSHKIIGVVETVQWRDGDRSEDLLEFALEHVLDNSDRVEAAAPKLSPAGLARLTTRIEEQLAEKYQDMIDDQARYGKLSDPSWHPDNSTYYQSLARRTRELIARLQEPKKGATG